MAVSRSLFALFALFLLLCGCGPQQSSGSSSTTLHVWYSTDDPVERLWSQQLARRYEAAHPRVHVDLVDYSFEDLNTKLQLALSSGNPPDLAYVTPRGPGIPAYVGAHRLRDLTAAALTNGWATRLRPGLLGSYNRPFSFLGIKPGHVVAVPTSLAAVGVMVNTRLLHRLHLRVPDSIRAFEAALARARRAGYTPIGVGNADGWLGDDWYLTLVNALVPSQLLEPEQRLNKAFSFKRPPYLQAAAILQRWSQHGYLTPNFGALDAQEGVDLFFHGKTLFQLVSSSENAQILQDQQQTGLPISIFAFPTANGGRVMPVSGYLGWVVPSAGQQPRQAISFINQLLAPSTADFLLSKGVLPSHSSPGAASGPSWLREYIQALDSSQPGVYLDAAPVANLNATMEANVQLLLQGYEAPEFLVKSLQEVYTSHGNRGNTGRIDGEF